ncbi:TetR family transcriptional regulator [Natronosporangium hydrolyticum]|uniref:TetR family transcriptional regulator n=1 Tax=Natronosporangium hydrolyticum TaxID=2811111 RepID=A0A895YFB3_9ACTN|nr:TetR/AcrR family transcriptional regulator [Natronosporangium hydrolyticum]QSB16554.1 TetR family transcriptional regulator [Natronosporangium hydrolyticum]
MARGRMTAAERGDQLVAAAVTAFAAGGYAGTSTDDVARRAGVSQAYVVRLFGSKQRLFLATLRHAADRIEQRFRAAAADEPTLARLGVAYADLLAERDLLAVVLHGSAASADPEVGAVMRAEFGRIAMAIRELTAATPDQVREFLADGMLLTLLGSMRAVGPGAEPPQPWLVELLATFPEYLRDPSAGDSRR